MRIRSGFTIIEILIVVSVVGVLLSIVTFSFSDVRQNAQVKTEEAAIAQFNVSFNLYRQLQGELPPAGVDVCTACHLEGMVMADAISGWQLVVDELVPQFAQGSITTDAWGNPYAYDKNDTTGSGLYNVLCSMGPDGQLQTYLNADLNDYLLTVPEPPVRGDDICTFFTNG